MTLLELMVVLVVVGVMVTLGLSTLSDWADYQRAATSARSVADAFSLARAEAIRTGSNHILAFDIVSGLSGVDADIVIANDGPFGSTAGVSSNCRIEAGEIVHRVPLERGVRFGAPSGVPPAPDDPGTWVEVGLGSSFKDAGNADASWILFGADGLPRRFIENGSTTPPCDDLGPAGGSAGAIYLTNDARTYGIVMTPLGSSRLHRYLNASAGWTQ